MALQGTDLFVVQSQSDKKLYSLKLSDLITEVESGSGAVNFRGGVDLNYGPSDQTSSGVAGLSNVALPANNGDLYTVVANCPSIAAGWVMAGGETTATKGDRIVYDGDNANWMLIATDALGGTVVGVTATLPLESDGDDVNPVISILEARTSTAAGAASDGKGTDGCVHRLAEAADVVHTAGSGDPRAVVTADLLKETNDHVAALELAPGGVTSVTTDDANGNSALSITPTTGAVKIEIETADDSNYGVVQVASASDITNGTAGGSAVIDASQLKDAVDALPQEAIVTITEGGTAIVSGALEITTTPRVDPDNPAEKDTVIGVKSETFCPYDFSSLTDINA